MKNKYRIVRDAWLGYEVQVKRWWWPFWYQMNGANTHETIDEAKEFIKDGGKAYRKRLKIKKKPAWEGKFEDT